jgi:nucleotide-binding universal stress UspA family protein
MKVLFATDGREAAGRAATLFKRFAARRNCALTVAAVADPMERFVGDREVRPISSVREQTTAVIDAAVEDFAGDGFDVRGRLLEGDPADELVHLLEREWFDVTVAGAGHGGWLGRLLLGSVSTHLLHAAPSSLLLVQDLRNRRPDEPARVLLGTDGSRGGDYVAHLLTQIADPARIVIQVASVIPMRGAPDITTEEPAKVIAARARACTEHAASLLGDAGFSTSTQVLSGSVTGHLLKEAYSIDADLIAVGSRGIGVARRALVGSVSDQVARLALAALLGRRLVT